ncbi:MAG: hypothetical protein HYX27_07320 [Acidobacteria bacterium]|nr:hypothetical protein [Acidobacteriota bacterium]
MFCDRCGTAVPASAAQCLRCGAPLAAVALVPAQTPRGAGGWIGAGWNAVTGNFVPFAVMGLFYLLASSAVPFLLQGPVAMGLQWAALKQVCGKRGDVNDLAYGFNLFPPAVLICLVTTVIIGAASILLIIPGILAAVFLQFPYLLVLDRNLDFWGAIKESFNVSQKHFGSLFGFFLLQLCVIIGGALLCGIGLVAAIPVVFAATAAAYIDLFGLREETRARLSGAPGQ